MDFRDFVLTRNTYTFSHLHPIFSYKSMLATMYWLQEEEIKYTQIYKDRILTIKVDNGAIFTTEDIGQPLCVDYKYCYPKKLDIYKIDLPVMLCTADDDLDDTYLSRFAPGLYSLIQVYRNLKGFKRYVACNQETRMMLNKWLDLDQESKQQTDVLFLVGEYDSRDVADNVCIGKELSVFEYEVDNEMSIRLTKTNSVITVKDDLLVVYDIES